jgi:hypothetical protein
VTIQPVYLPQPQHRGEEGDRLSVRVEGGEPSLTRVSSELLMKVSSELMTRVSSELIR